MRCAIDLWDENGKAIEPGYGGSHYQDESPFPVPSVGDTLISLGAKWKVVDKTIEYQTCEDGVICVHVNVYCRVLEPRTQEERS